ncbi:MAG: hypothetical protein KAH01_03675 [Caldisericia bacterium]|nr:hypothetical protein [Caldisericia bacterium]
MKSNNVTKWLVWILVLLIAVFGVWFIVRKISNTRTLHDTFRGDIENVYYVTKELPKKLYSFSNLKDGDSVSLSVWHNNQSTVATQMKNYGKMFNNHEKNSTKFKEAILIPDVKSILDDSSSIGAYITLRVESPSDFSESKYQSMKEDLESKLATFSKKAKDYNFDLR